MSVMCFSEEYIWDGVQTGARNTGACTCLLLIARTAEGEQQKDEMSV